MKVFFRSVWWMFAVKVMGVALGLAALVRLPGLRDVFHLDHLRVLVVHSGLWGYALLLILGSCLPIALMPRWPFAILCGFAYGIRDGVLLSSLTGVLGAGLHYGLAQLLLSDRERAALENMSWFRSVQSSSHPFLAIMAVRLFPLSNFAITNLACGLLRIPFRCYLSASFIGMLPSTLVYVMVGHGVLSNDMRSVVTLFGAVSLLLLVSAFAGGARLQNVADRI